MLYAIQFATLELKMKVFGLLKNNKLEIYKRIQQGPRITRLMIRSMDDMGMVPLEDLMKIHEEIFMQEVSREEKTLDVKNIRKILDVFQDSRIDNEVKAYMKGLLARIEVSKFENREKIKDMINKEYLEQ